MRLKSCLVIVPGPRLLRYHYRLSLLISENGANRVVHSVRFDLQQVLSIFILLYRVDCLNFGEAHNQVGMDIFCSKQVLEYAE